MQIVTHSWVTPLTLLLSVLLPLSLNVSGCRLNTSPSLPLGLYQLTSIPITTGATVILCLPPDLATEALHRKILRPSPFSNCPANAQPVLKLALALPGDTVTITTTALSVNGRATATWPHYRPDPDHPTPLPHSTTLGANRIWLHAPHPHSWDSRHFGPIEGLSTARVARPILTYTPKALR